MDTNQRKEHWDIKLRKRAIEILEQLMALRREYEAFMDELALESARVAVDLSEQEMKIKELERKMLEAGHDPNLPS